MKDKKQLPLEQKEKAVHGERIFPLKKYLTTLQERYPIVTPHWHEEAEFTLITSGVCTYQVDLESFQAMPGDFVFIPPLALHSIAILPAGHMHSETYVFHLDFLFIGCLLFLFFLDYQGDLRATRTCAERLVSDESETETRI